MAKKTVNLAGKQVEGEAINFKALEEPWCVYECEDGTEIRMKLVLSEIVRIKDAFGPEGDPIYTLKSTNIVATQVPDELRQKPKGSGGKSGNYI